MKKRYLLLFVLALMTLLSGCSMPEEELNYNIDKDTAVVIVKSIVQTYDDIPDAEYDYYVSNGDNLDKSAASGFRAAQTTDHVGAFVYLDTTEANVEFKNGARGNILCSVVCQYENRPVKVTVSFVENKDFEYQKSIMRKQLEEAAVMNNVEVKDIIDYFFAGEGYDSSDEEAFLSQYVTKQYQMFSITPDECEVSPIYSKAELMKKAAVNTGIGMGVVFAVLIFIAFIIYLLRFVPVLLGTEKASDKGEKKNKKDKAATTTAAKKPAAAPSKTKAEKKPDAAGENLVNDSQLVVVITAAINAYIDSTSGTASRGPVTTDSKDKLVVRSIRRVR